MSALPGAAHVHAVRVYYEDTDFSGVVYHASYLRFLERGRTEWLRALGLDQATLLAEGGVALAVRSMTIDFRAAARMDDLLAVETELQALAGASLTLAQRVTRGSSVLVAAGVRIACVSGARAARLPARLRQVLARSELTRP